MQCRTVIEFKKVFSVTANQLLLYMRVHTVQEGIPCAGISLYMGSAKYLHDQVLFHLHVTGHSLHAVPHMLLTVLPL